jgi:thiamine biosynthesis lipoprotein
MATLMTSHAGWTEVWMDTLVTIQLAVPACDAAPWAPSVERAFRWFAAVEAACSRFDPTSEVSRLVHQVDRPVRVSPILAGALRFSLLIAAATGGAFDPAIGHRLEAAGYDREYRTGLRRRSRIDAAARPTYRDVVLDPCGETVTLRQPVLLDLGGVAKGIAVDLAARELAYTPGAVVDAGGDVYAHGTDYGGRLWRVGLAHPRRRGSLLGTVDVTDAAVGTSGDYARGAHIFDPRTPAMKPAESGRPALPAPDTQRPVAVTVLAPTAAAADALSTAAIVLGLAAGRQLLEHTSQVEGVLVTSAGDCITTTGFPRESLIGARAW